MGERTNFIISYLADIVGIKAKLKELNRINTEVANEFGDGFKKATRIIKDGVEDISRTTVKLKGGKEQTTELRTLSTVIKTVTGDTKTLVETQKRVDGAIKSSTAAFKSGSAGAKSFKQNLSDLVNRAALTIPTWFLLRNSISTVFRSVREGFQSFVDFDRILQKAKRNLQGTSEQIESDFQRIRKEIQSLAEDTGESAKDIADAFQRFATLGFDAETALAGATAATKLAVLQFDDLDNIANGLARTFKVLSNSFGENTSDAENLNKTVALLDELWKENAFDARELIAALQRFAPTASRLNISLEESAKLLATLQSSAVVSTRAGRLLGRTFDELAVRIGKVGKVLGIEVNPQVEGTTKTFLEVIRALEQLREEEGFSPKLQSALKELFGGRLGREAAAGITAIRVQLEKNIALTGDVDKFNQALADVEDTVSRQVKIFGELSETVKRSFIVGIAGGDDFAESMDNINKFLRRNIETAKIFGEVLREDGRIISDIAAGVVTLGGGTIFKALKKDIEDASNKASELFDDINDALFGRLDATQVQDVLDRAIAESTSNIRGAVDITQPILDALTNVRDRLNNGEPLEINLKTNTKEVDEGLKKIKTAQTQINSLTNDQEKITKRIIKNQLDILKAEGATESAILKAEGSLLKQLGIREDKISRIQRELDLEREIAKEKRLQNNLSSESLKLFDIAKTDGVNVARDIADVLSGKLDFSNFIKRSDKAAQVFKEKFSDVFNAKQAERFFQGSTVDGLRGGSRIGIQENLTGSSRFNVSAQLAQDRAFRQLAQQTATPAVSVSSDVNVNISGLGASEVGNKIKKSILDDLSNPSSDFSRKIDKKIEDY